MPIPASVNHRVVFATYLDAGGAPAVGFVTFTPSLVLTDQSDTTFIALEPLVAELDGTGYMAADLMCTDDPDLQPQGWSWIVEEHIPGGRKFAILVPNGSTPIPLTSLGVAQELPQNLTTTYVPWAAVGSANGVPPLDSAGIIPTAYLPGSAELVIFSPVSPLAPAVDQLWWNTASLTLARWNGSAWDYLSAAANEYEFTFTIAGPVPFGSPTVRYYLDFPIIIDSVRASLGASPVGSFLRCDVLVSGVSIFGAPEDRPTINPGEFTSSVTSSATAGGSDYLTFDVTDIGSVSPGSGLVLVVRARRSA